jgi:hypothetical protein
VLRRTPWNPRSLRGNESRSARSPLPVMRRRAPVSNLSLPLPASPASCLVSAAFRLFSGAGDGIRTRDIQLGRLELYQLSYTRLDPSRPETPCRVLSSPQFASQELSPASLAARCPSLEGVSFLESSVVGREGFEPSKAEGRQIYSLLRLTASLPPPQCRRPMSPTVSRLAVFPTRSFGGAGGGN